jgi:stage II sporulation protein D
MTSLLRLVLFSFALVQFIQPNAVAGPAVDPVIRIKLSRFFPVGCPTLIVTCSGPFNITDDNGTSVVGAPTGSSYEFEDITGVKVSVTSVQQQPDTEESEAGGVISSLYFTVQSSPGSVITLSEPGSIEHHYRGEINVAPGLSAVNSLPLEDYLKGVLGPEIGSSAPVEALKAQAIAARTYTVRNLGKMAMSGADMDDTTLTQQYLGVDGETPTIDTAVDDTAGEVLLYNGALINAVYSTDCGGITGAGDASEPYLSPVADPECAEEPPWQYNITAQQAEDLLGMSDPVNVRKIEMTVAELDSSGRAATIKIVGGSQSNTISGAQFRKSVGYDKIKSTLFSIEQQNDGSFMIVGHGWGHGLGLCQRGAIYLAQHAILCADILHHYYTGASVAQLNPGLLSGLQSEPTISANSALSTLPDP